ncbi:hypothetical protein A2U01_0090500, partial [Trifolium medium]|nr:hypothetical protein [Trifolium medium]
LPARIGSPRQKRGKPPNNYSIVIGLRKGWSSWLNKDLPRADLGETKGIKV